MASGGSEVQLAPPPSPALIVGDTPIYRDEPVKRVCRLCGQESNDGFDIFGDEGRSEQLPEKCFQCLPVAVSVLCNALFVYWREQKERSKQNVSALFALSKDLYYDIS